MTDSFLNRASRGSFLAHYLKRASQSVQRQTVRILKDQSELTVQQWWIISDVIAEGFLRMGQIEDFASADMPDVHQDVSILMERDLLTVDVDKSDHRMSVVEATPAANLIYSDLLQTMLRRDEQLSWGISAEKIEMFLELLGEIEAAANKPVPIEEPKSRAIRALKVHKNPNLDST